MPTIRSSYWQFNKPCPALLDPRIQIVQHTAWQQSNKKVSLFGIEPDNYNFAIFDDKPHDIKFIKDQCWYKIDKIFRRNRIQGWMSLYVILDRDTTIKFNQEIIKLQPTAVWKFDKAQPIRPKRQLMHRENSYRNRSETNFSTEERLWQLGYYENLKNKYLNDEEYFLKVVGQPREAVLNPYYQDDSEEEVEDF